MIHGTVNVNLQGKGRGPCNKQRAPRVIRKSSASDWGEAGSGCEVSRGLVDVGEIVQLLAGELTRQIPSHQGSAAPLTGPVLRLRMCPGGVDETMKKIRVIEQCFAGGGNGLGEIVSPLHGLPIRPPSYADGVAIATALISANPNRIVWGTDCAPRHRACNSLRRKPVGTAGCGSRFDTNRYKDSRGQPRRGLRVSKST